MTSDWDDTPSELAADVNRERSQTYGDPTPNMEMFAHLLSAYLQIPVSAEDASVVMVLVKIMREKQAGFPYTYRDNRVDICGWTNVLEAVIRNHHDRPK